MANMATQVKREHWSSKIGFIITTAGAAVGLGNLQRFPYMVAENGGAAFVFIYLLCVILLSVPLMLVEFAIGRNTDSNPIDALKKLRPNSPWKYVGVLAIATPFFILSYYLVAAGWTLGYMIQMLTGATMPHSEYAANAYYSLSGVAAILIPTIFIVKKGLKQGLEKWSKILMPILLILMLFLVVRTLFLPNSLEGIKFYLYPDFTQISAKTFLYAMSQAFFSLCIGEAVLITYGSYAKKEDNLISSAIYIALFDTVIALVAGFIIFPALFSFGLPPGQGAGLVYNVMPHVFFKLPFGFLFGAAYFLVLTFAALTTCIALLDMPVAYLIESRGWSSYRATWTVGGAAFLCSIPAALSLGANTTLTELSLPFFHEKGFYNVMDFLWGNLGMVIGGLSLSIFTGWFWGIESALKELRRGCPYFTWQGKIWGLIIKFFAPLAISFILLSLLF